MNTLKNMKIKQNGFSLLEVMIAMALGLFLIAIIITIYLGAQSTFRATNEVSRTQETTRFATNFLATDIRMAGFTACADSVSKRNNLDETNSEYIPSIPYTVFGWEYTGTDIGDTYELTYDIADEAVVTAGDVATLRAANTAGAGNWASQFRVNGGAATAVTLPAAIANLSPLVGSDIIAVTIATPLTNLLIANQLPASETNPILATVDFQLNPVATGVADGQIVKIGDCSSIDIFQNKAGISSAFFEINDTDLNNFKADFAWQKSWGQSSTVYSLETKVYFIGTGANGTPSLFRYSNPCGNIGDCDLDPETVELIEGVENMQILYGQDINDDKAPDSYFSADQVTDYSNIASVKLGLLMRSPNIGSDGAANTNTYNLNNNIIIDPPNENNLRFMTNTTIQLRNSGI